MRSVLTLRSTGVGSHTRELTSSTSKAATGSFDDSFVLSACATLTCVRRRIMKRRRVEVKAIRASMHTAAAARGMLRSPVPRAVGRLLGRPPAGDRERSQPRAAPVARRSRSAARRTVALATRLETRTEESTLARANENKSFRKKFECEAKANIAKGAARARQQNARPLVRPETRARAPGPERW